MQITTENFPKCQMPNKEGECGNRALTTFGNGVNKKWMCGLCANKYEEKIHKLKEQLWLEE